MKRGRLLWIFGSMAVAGLVVIGLLARFLSAVLSPSMQLAPSVDIHLPGDRLLTAFHMPITNTLLASWLATLLLVGFFLAARWRARMIPRGLQNISEALLEAMLTFTVSIAGERRVRLLFPLAATLFLFIAANALVALLPVFGPVVVTMKDGSQVPLLRGAGTDINMSLALAVVAGLVVEGAGFLTLRLRYIQHFFPVHYLLEGRWLLGVMELLAGLIKGVTHLFRLLSFTFRLFGNLTAGEVLLLTMSFLAPLVLGVPFYGLELLIGLVQAGIFAGLTVALAVNAMTLEEVASREENHVGGL